MATLVDVARHAGVATSTVSHVLNGTRYVSAETTRAVRQAVEAVGYTPNTLARALARSTTNTIGLAVSASRNRYFADVINAVEEECSKLGMMVLLANTKDDPRREAEVVAELHRRRVDGIILAPAAVTDRRTLAYLRDNTIPTVLVDRLPSDTFDAVGVENRDAVITMIDHLARHGHRRIGILAGQAGFTTALERIEGYKQGLGRNGLPVDEALVSIDNTDLAQAEQAALAMLSRPEPATAMIGGNNLTTLGIMTAIRRKAWRVPADVALVGFDDFEWSDAFSPRLTAMVQPCSEIGQTAATMLQQRIESFTGPARTIRLQPTFVIRESCGCAG